MGACLAYGCDCELVSLKQAKRSAIIFQGTIVELRDSGKSYQIAKFRVSRVWKGNVKETFEMPAFDGTNLCFGFNPRFLKVGTDLLVYANKVDLVVTDYFPTICGRTGLVAESNDVQYLGPARRPNSK